jgi:hypothetical protein
VRACATPIWHAQRTQWRAMSLAAPLLQFDINHEYRAHVKGNRRRVHVLVISSVIAHRHGRVRRGDRAARRRCRGEHAALHALVESRYATCVKLAAVNHKHRT